MTGKTPLRKRLGSLHRSERGATAIEYGLILGVIGLGLIASVGGMADISVGMWDYVDNRVAAAS